MGPKGRGRGGAKKKEPKKGKTLAKKGDVPRGKRQQAELTSSDEEDLLLDSSQVHKKKSRRKQKAKSPSPTSPRGSPKSPTPPPAKGASDKPEDKPEEEAGPEASEESALEEEGQGTQEIGGEIYLH